MKKQIFNPYLPCYEYIPDGEPRIFGDRLYIFGSHDRFGGKTFCENDYVTWSAPIDDLSDWHFEGEIYRKDQDPRPGNLYAPDVVQGPDGRYYLYYSKAETSVISVAVCDTPVGKYEYLGDVSYPDGRVMGEAAEEYFHFDPSVLIDEGRVWLYSGSGQYGKQKRTRQKIVGCMVIELETDMVTVKQAPKVLLPGAKGYGKKAFFEGASARKIGDLYYLVFPTLDMTGLNYATSRYPDRDFTIRGSIHSTSDIGIGKYSMSNPAYPLGNNHGGLVCIRDRWYIFDHRMTNRTMFSRQGVAEPVTIGPDGTIRQVESTSCGLNGGPLRGEGTYPAHIACNLLRGSILSGCPYLTQDKPDGDITARQYVAGMQNGSRVGYKYFDFSTDTLEFTLQYRCSGKGTLEIMQSDGALAVGSVFVSRTNQWREGSCTLYVAPGKSGLYLKYSGTGSLELLEFTFG